MTSKVNLFVKNQLNQKKSVINIRLGKQFSLLIYFDNFYFSNLHSLKSDSNTIQFIVQPKNIWLYQISNKKICILIAVFCKCDHAIQVLLAYYMTGPKII